MAKRTIKDTDKSRNIQVSVTGDISLDAMERVLADVVTELGLILSHITTLSRKKYPNNRHWHFKEDLKSSSHHEDRACPVRDTVRSLHVPSTGKVREILLKNSVFGEIGEIFARTMRPTF